MLLRLNKNVASNAPQGSGVAQCPCAGPQRARACRMHRQDYRLRSEAMGLSGAAPEASGPEIWSGIPAQWQLCFLVRGQVEVCNVLTDIEIAQQLQKDAAESEPDSEELPVSGRAHANKLIAASYIVHCKEVVCIRPWQRRHGCRFTALYSQGCPVLPSCPSCGSLLKRGVPAWWSMHLVSGIREKGLPTFVLSSVSDASHGSAAR